jgi:ABC-type multidrug transport system ATPase subunit
VEAKFYPWVDALFAEIAKHEFYEQIRFGDCTWSAQELRRSRRRGRGVDLDVPAGQIVGLIGANGAGKTTVVECIQGLRRPDAGVLRVLGLDPSTQPERLRPLIGSQLQDSALPDRSRVGEAVSLFSTDVGGHHANDLIEPISESWSPSTAKTSNWTCTR